MKINEIYTPLNTVCDGFCLECDGGCVEEDDSKTKIISHEKVYSSIKICSHFLAVARTAEKILDIQN